MAAPSPDRPIDTLGLYKRLVRQLDVGEHDLDATTPPPEALAVVFRKRPGPHHHGAYEPDGPRIVVYRDDEDTTGRASAAVVLANDPAEELSYFVHELGHHFSNLRGTYRKFSKRERFLSYTEEVRAWTIGRHVLRDGGYWEWDAFTAIRQKCLAGYARGLRVSKSDQQRAVDIVARELDANPISSLFAPQ